MTADASVLPGLRGFRRTFGPADLPALGALHRIAVAALVDAVAAIRGEAAAAVVREHGLGRLHEVLRPLDVTPLRDRVLDRLRAPLLEAAVAVGRELVGWRQDFFVDDYLILRVNFPFETAREAPGGGENPGVGRVSPSVRDLARRRRVKDPVYDPGAYHAGLPPAAWAHGPHLDSWTGHSRDGLNIWWAMDEVPANAGMVLYPETADRVFGCDPRSLYVQPGAPLPPPTYAPLAGGEMLVFDPEILHGTHLNVSGVTRVAISMRLNAAEPRFDPDCFYAREFWRRASDIEAGRFDAIQHLARETHLAPSTRPAPAAPVETPCVTDPLRGPDGAVVIASIDGIPEGGRLRVALSDREILVLRTGGRLYAVDAHCPHYGLALCDGGVDGRRIFCPGCAVGFELATGASPAACLSLQRYEVFERESDILLQPSAEAVVVA